MMVSLLVIAEGAWRVYLYRTGRGFFDDPHEFISPFFTTFDEPMPVITPQAFYYRNGSVPRDKPADEIRVICFGGSTTVNFRAGGSYPERIEARLTADGLGPVRVLNAGGEGYSTAHILVNLALRNLAAKPDVITVYENINDLSAIYFGDGVEPDYANKSRNRLLSRPTTPKRRTRGDLPGLPLVQGHRIQHRRVALPGGRKQPCD